MEYFSLRNSILICLLITIYHGECVKIVTNTTHDEPARSFASEPTVVCNFDTDCNSVSYSALSVCVDNRCKCRAGHNWDYLTGRCKSFICDGDYTCHTYDSNRYCSKNGDCLCKMNYEPDHSNGEKCQLGKQSSCSHDSDCNDINQVCVNSVCHCAADYRFDGTDKKCHYQPCNSITDCSNYWDNMRVCRGGSCVCYDDDYKEDLSNGRKCEFQFTSWNWGWMWVLIVFPVVFILLVTALVIRYRRRQMQSQTPVMVFRY